MKTHVGDNDLCPIGLQQYLVAADPSSQMRRLCIRIPKWYLLVKVEVGLASSGGARGGKQAVL